MLYLRGNTRKWIKTQRHPKLLLVESSRSLVNLRAQSDVIQKVFTPNLKWPQNRNICSSTSGPRRPIQQEPLWLCLWTCQDRSVVTLEDVYLDLLGVWWETFDLANSLLPPQHQGLTAALASHTADIHPLQEMHVNLPDLGGCCHPPIPAQKTTIRNDWAETQQDQREVRDEGGWSTAVRGFKKKKLQHDHNHRRTDEREQCTFQL